MAPHAMSTPHSRDHSPSDQSLRSSVSGNDISLSSRSSVTGSDQPYGETDLLEPIAIVGQSIQFPGGAVDDRSFWDIISDGRCVVQDAPKERIDLSGLFHPDRSRLSSIPLKGGHFLTEDITAFDAPFFSISATEAGSMDPQQRLLLEVSYRAFENAGIPISKVQGSRTSVFVGCFTDDYKTLYQKDLQYANNYAATGITPTLNANRISWFFNTRGTSVNLDTACSSSLVAMDLAVQNLRSGECDMSLVGGVNLMMAPDMFQILSDMNMLSPDSQCWSFDSRGNGYGRGEGVGVLVLKRLSSAIANGDTIRAVIRSSGSNQDGYTPGITQPNKHSQEQLIRECYTKAGLDPRRTRYFEAHGTGTPVGDPIESDAIGSVFRQGRLPSDPLYIGSVKANIGHLEGASGIAGVIKSVLILEKGVIPKIAKLEVLNSRIDEEHLRLKFPKAILPWPKPGLRRISVNSFGFGGSNAHVILDDAFHFLREHGLQGITSTAEHPPPSEDLLDRKEGLIMPASVTNSRAYGKSAGFLQGSPRIIVLSAADEKGVRRNAESISKLITDSNMESGVPEGYLNALAYTLSERRSLLPWKSYAVVEATDEMTKLTEVLSKPHRSTGKPRLAFIFTGQGAQWPEMGKELLAYDVFRQSLLDAEIYLQSIGSNWRLLDELLRPVESSRISEPELSQPLCTAIQIALVELLEFFEVEPSVVIGHSSGEIAASYACGAISRESAWKIAYYRGVHTSQLYNKPGKQGAMLAVGLSPNQTTEYIKQTGTRAESLTIACFNSPKSVTVSGDEPSIDALESLLKQSSVFARKVRTGAAYHSSHMEVVAEDYASSIGAIESRTDFVRDVPMISTVYAQRAQHKSLRQPSYWVGNLVSPVRFEQGFEQVCSRSKVKKLDGSHLKHPNIDICVEIGPHGALKGPMRDILASKGRKLPHYSALWRSTSGLQSVLSLAGDLWSQGYSVNLRKVNHGDMPTSSLTSLVDLPTYAFDHSKSYLHESRLARNHRTHSQPRLDLLGSRAMDWNPLEAKWTNFIKLSEVPWVEDHRVNGTTLYPAAGMMVMAIEALKQLVPPEQNLNGFELRDVSLDTALAIPSHEQGIEIQFSVHSKQNSHTRQSGWSDFRLFASNDGNWTEICSGQVRADFGQIVSEVDTNSTDAARLASVLTEHNHVSTESQAVEDMSAFYAKLRESGFEFGPSFQTIKDASFSKDGVTGAVGVHPWSEESGSHPQEHIVHPATLDGLLHLPMVAYTQGASIKKPTIVPSSIRRAWISNKELSYPVAQRLSAVSRLLSQDNRGIELQVYATDADKSQVLVELEGLRMTVVGQVLDTDEPFSQKNTLWNPIWRPDVDLATVPELQTICEAAIPCQDGPADFYEQLAYFHYATLLRITERFVEADITTKSDHFLKYFRWVHQQLDLYHAQKIRFYQASWKDLARDEDYYHKIAYHLESVNAQGRTNVAVARNIQGILLGEVDPLEVLFKGPLLEDLYTELSNENNSFKLLEQYLKLYSHKNPNARYLEIGAGTGGSTTNILNSLIDGADSSSPYALYSKYVYSDISESFFEHAKVKFQEYPNMQYKRFDVEKEITIQGFEEDSFDVIFAANVLHATKDINATITRVNKLLKPGGKLILFEVTKPELGRTGFTMGTLAGWWLSVEPFRNQGPCMSTDRWGTVFKDAGFNGIEQEFRDYINTDCHELSVIVTSKKVDSPRQSQPLINIVSNADSASSTQISFRLAAHLSANGYYSRLSTDLRDINLAETPENSITIFADNFSKAFLADMDSEAFHDLQLFTLKHKKIIWLTRTVGNGSSDPVFAIVDGISRACRTEVEGSTFVTVGLEGNDELSPKQLTNLVNIVKSVQVADEQYEMAFEEKDGIFQVCRLRKDFNSQEGLQQRLQPNVSQELKWSEAPPLRLTAETPGMLESLVFVDDPQAELPLEADEVEIQVHAMGMNFKDCLIALGRVAGNTLGNECAGVVTRVGVNSSNRFKPGDRVCMSTDEAFKTFARGKAQCVCRLPDNISFTDAAAIPTQFVTAWVCINEIGRLAKGDSVLIHAGAGGVGQAAIQISQILGAEAFVTVGSVEKKQLLMSEYGVPEDHIFYSRDTSFASRVKDATKGRGVDVVLNSLAGESLLASWDCLAPYGRFVEIGKRDILANSSLPMLQFNKGVSFSAFDGSIWMNERPNQAERNIAAVMEMFEKGSLHTARPLQVYDVSQIHEAFRILADGKSIGKLVIEVRQESRVPTNLVRKSSCDFAPDATYVIAGGFGGIGRSTARWMAQRGARSLVLLSRSGPSSAEAHELVEELESMKVKVHTPKCDIADAESLRQAIQSNDCKLPIRGCIQASMVLQDSPWDKMSHSQWKHATNPKIAGSWNLHEQLPSSMDFFVLLSSVSGISGLHGQANYAAGNTYQDALAHYRVSRGEKAVAINMGAMVDDGYVVGKEDVQRRLVAQSAMVPITRDEMFAMFDYYCNPSVNTVDLDHCQVVIGINTPQKLRAQGFDEPAYLARPMFSVLHRIPATGSLGAGDGGSGEGSERDFRGEFIAATTPAEAALIASEALFAKLSRSLSSLSDFETDVRRPMVSFGLDSLLAVEIRSWIARTFQADVPVFEILGGADITSTGVKVANVSMLKKTEK